MADFGFCLPIFAWPGAGLFRAPGWPALDARRCMALGRLADELGYASLWVADHLMLGAHEAILEGWTTLAALAGMTQRARLGIIHYNNVFRHPAFTAKMLATLDQITGGRMIHFVDFGNNAREYLAYGMLSDMPREERIARMVEGLALCRAMWQADAPVNFAGAYYNTRDAVCTPKPAQTQIPVWMGECWPGMPEAAAAYADAWNSTPAPMDELARRLAVVDAACHAAGRDPATLKRTLEIQVLIAPALTGLREKLAAMLALAPAGQPVAAEMLAFVRGETDALSEELRTSWWAGTPGMVRDRVRACMALGFSHFMLWFVDAPDDSGMRLFADAVMPEFCASG